VADADFIQVIQQIGGIVIDSVRPTTHADLPVNGPNGELHAARFEHFTPREHVLIDAIDECSIEIEEKCCLRWCRVALCHLVLSNIIKRPGRTIDEALVCMHRRINHCCGRNHFNSRRPNRDTLRGF
jgi:hypothetical protein